MEATNARQHPVHSIATAWNEAKNLSNSQKLELVSIIIDSIKPFVACKVGVTDDEEYSLRPFTKEELNARIDQAEAEIAAGLGTSHEEVMREMDEEIERWEQEDLKLEMASVVGRLFGKKRQKSDDRPLTYRNIIINGLNKMVYRIEGDIIYIVDFWDTRREPTNQAAQTE